MTEAPRYWFRAKRYGYGWGLATCWQGWACYGAYLALCLGSVALPALAGRSHPALSTLAMMAITGGATIALIAICRIKGEPARWRWGDD